jgi:hypothetical protein
MLSYLFNRIQGLLESLLCFTQCDLENDQYRFLGAQPHQTALSQTIRPDHHGDDQTDFGAYLSCVFLDGSSVLKSETIPFRASESK